jgi:cytochrome P450
MELTTQMLATLFDFPFEDRHTPDLLVGRRDHAPGPDSPFKNDEEHNAVLMIASRLRPAVERAASNSEPATDLISMLARWRGHAAHVAMNSLGNIILLIVGGNDTTRNTMTGSVALNQNPDQYQKLRATIPNSSPRWYRKRSAGRPAGAHAAHRALRYRDRRQAYQEGRQGRDVVRSGNRDETVIENPNSYIIDRERPRQHMSFGFGIHRCVGNRLAEMQLRIVWEEILKRFPVIEVVGEPTRPATPFVKGYQTLPVRIPPSATLPARPEGAKVRKAEPPAV